MIRIVLADDHIMFRQAIARALDDVDGFQVVGQVSTAEEALAEVGQLAPNVVLMDIGMPGMGGLAGTEALRKACPQVAVLILTVHHREDYFFKALQVGASGYILKGADLDELIQAVQTVALGKFYIFPSMLPRLVAEYLHRPGDGQGHGDQTHRLSPREREVLGLLAAGKTTSEIAVALVISPHTVRRHGDHIMEKLNLHSRLELIRFATRKGLLDEPG